MKSLEDGSWPNIYSMIKLLLTEKKTTKANKVPNEIFNTYTIHTIIYGALNCVVNVT